jgi:HSP20 family protein
VEFDQGVLRITAERKEEKEENNERYHVQERRYGTVSRALRLPKTANPEDIKASYKDGVLSVQVGKLPSEEARKKAIRVD